MIPRVRTWRVRILNDDGSHKATLYIETITRRMARLIVRMDYPFSWGHKLVISPCWSKSHETTNPS